MGNVPPTVDPQYTVLDKRYKDYIFDYILFICDKISFYKSIIPIISSGTEAPAAQTPLVANPSDCTRISYYFGSQSPGNITTTSSAVKSKCLSLKLRFVYRVKIYPSTFRQNDLSQNFDSLINSTLPRANHLFAKKLFLAPELVLQPDKSYKVCMRCVVVLDVMCEHVFVI